MNKLPCTNCITLPICKNQYREMINEPKRPLDYVPNSFIVFKARNKLTSKCILLDQYVYKDENYDYDTKADRRVELHKFMTGEENGVTT